MSALLSHLVGGALLWRLWEMNTAPIQKHLMGRAEKKKQGETRHLKSLVFAKELEMLSGVLYRW